MDKNLLKEDFFKGESATFNFSESLLYDIRFQTEKFGQQLSQRHGPADA